MPPTDYELDTRLMVVRIEKKLDELGSIVTNHMAHMFDPNSVIVIGALAWVIGVLMTVVGFLIKFR